MPVTFHHLLGKGAVYENSMIQFVLKACPVPREATKIQVPRS